MPAASPVLDHLFASSILHTLAALPLKSLLAVGSVLTFALASKFSGGFFRPFQHRLRRPAAASRLFHVQTFARARYACRKLDEIGPTSNPSKAFSFLRAVCPFVFEEMILQQLSRRKLVVHRNVRYTGDGGVDGAFEIDGQKWLVQAKRYSGMVRTPDVMDFVSLCESSGRRGLFIHTGRTPAGAHTLARYSECIDIISGERLLAFFAGDPLRLRVGEAGG